MYTGMQRLAHRNHGACLDDHASWPGIDAVVKHPAFGTLALNWFHDSVRGTWLEGLELGSLLEVRFWWSAVQGSQGRPAPNTNWFLLPVFPRATTSGHPTTMSIFLSNPVPPYDGVFLVMGWARTQPASVMRVRWLWLGSAAPIGQPLLQRSSHL